LTFNGLNDVVLVSREIVLFITTAVGYSDPANMVFVVAVTLETLYSPTATCSDMMWNSV
jgi:hypothetical protein